VKGAAGASSREHENGEAMVVDSASPTMQSNEADIDEVVLYQINHNKICDNTNK